VGTGTGTTVSQLAERLGSSTHERNKPAAVKQLIAAGTDHNRQS
jgi:hypothetical protein